MRYYKNYRIQNPVTIYETSTKYQQTSLIRMSCGEEFCDLQDLQQIEIMNSF